MKLALNAGRTKAVTVATGPSAFASMTNGLARTRRSGRRSHALERP